MSTYNGKIKVVKARPRSKRLRDIGGIVSTVTSSREVAAAPSVDLSRYMIKETFDELFEKVNLGTAEVPHWAIKAKLNLFTVGWLSFNGSQIGDGSAGDTPVAGAQNLADLKDVSLGNILPGQVLSWNGNKWVNSTLATSGFDELQLSQYLTSHNYAHKSDIPSLAGYATESWVLQKLQSIGADDLFEKVNLGTELAPVWAIKAKYNLYTVGWLSFRGPQVGGGGDDTPATIASNLADLKDVDLDTLAPGQVLAWSGTKWTNTTPVTSGFDESSIADYLASHNYATHQWVTSQGFLKQHQSLAGYATESWVNDQGFLTQHQSLAGYATESWVNAQNFATQDALGDYYNKTQIDTALGNKLDKATFDDLFEKVNLGTDAAPKWAIKAKYNFYTVGWLSFRGSNDGSGGSASAGAANLADLKDVSLGSLAAGQALVWNGAKWVNSTIATSGLDEASLSNYLTSHGYATQQWANDRYYTKTEVDAKNFIKDAGDGRSLMFNYSANALGYDNFTWVAVWNGNTLQCCNKSLFATASALASGLSGKVNKSGDTMTGQLTIHNGTYNKTLVLSSAGADAKSKGPGILFNGSETDRSQGIVLRHEWYDTFTPGYGLAISRDTSLETGDANMWLYNTGRYISKVPTGTKPIDVVSTTLCTNLNADTVDGVHASSFLYYKGAVLSATTAIAGVGLYGWNTAASSNFNGFGHGYGDSIVFQGHTTWYNRLDFCTNGQIDFWHAINPSSLTGSMSKVGTLAFLHSTVANANSLGGKAAAQYVTTDTAQTITGAKTFTSYTKIEQALMFKGGPNGVYFATNANGNLYISAHANYSYIKNIGHITPDGSLTMASFVKTGGTASQFLMADGSVVTKKTATAPCDLGWVNNDTGNSSVPTIAVLAYWDGAYLGGGSNLKYCNRGRFGTMATASASDYLARSGGSMTNTNVVTNMNADLLDGLHLDSVRGYRVEHPAINSSLAVGNVPFNAFGMQHGTPLFIDPEFASGTNNVSVYNNLQNGNVTVTRIADNQASANSSGYILQIKVTGAAEPWIGGFVQATQSRANAVFMQIFRAKIPVGYNVNANSNRMGDNYSDVWITSTAGTGKWEWYARVVYCGASGSFSLGGYVSLKGANATAANPLYWYLSHCQTWDLSKNNYGSLRAKFADALSASRTLWGQSFNGSNNVSGGMTGVGTITSTYYSLHNISNNPYLKFNVGGNNTYVQALSTGIGVGPTHTALFVTNDSKVGIGTASPSEKLSIAGWVGTIGATGWYNITYGGGWWMQGNTYIENYGSKRIKISGINDYCAVWIAGGGLCCEGYGGTSWGNGHGALNVGIANNVAQTPLLLAYRIGAGIAGASRLFDMELLNNGGELRWHFANNMRFRFLSTGEFYASKGIWTDGYLSFRGQNTSSDGRFKDIQERITLPLAVIANAPSIIYRWVDNGKMEMGSIAQYWQKYLPLAVSTNPLGLLGMDYSKIALASAISIAQSLMTTQDDVKILKADVRQLKADNLRMTTENSQLKTEIQQLRTKIAV